MHSALSSSSCAGQYFATFTNRLVNITFTLTSYTLTWPNNEQRDAEKNIEDIYFFEVNTKCISSNVLKISVISRVRSTNKITDICKTFDELALVFTEKNVIVFLWMFEFNATNKILEWLSTENLSSPLFA